MTTLTHPTLIDPATGAPLEAIGFRANGAPIWPMIGGANDLDNPGLPDGVDDTDDGEPDEDPEPDPDPVKGGDDKSKKDDPDDSDEDDDEDDKEPWDEERARKAIAKRNRENRSLRDKLAKRDQLTKAEREELEKLRDEKRTDKEKLENRAKKGEDSASELRAQLEEAKIRLALGLPEPDDDSDEDDPFVDIPLKGDSLEEKLASAKRFAKKYGIGRYKTEEPAAPKRKTPPAKNLRGSGPNDDDGEDDPIKLAARVKSNTFGIH